MYGLLDEMYGGRRNVLSRLWMMKPIMVMDELTQKPFDSVIYCSYIIYSSLASEQEKYGDETDLHNMLQKAIRNIV